MENKTKTKDIHCACAMGDLSEYAPVKPEKNVTKKQRKHIKKDDFKNVKSINKK